jgi:hypothetical protein
MRSCRIGEQPSARPSTGGDGSGFPSRRGAQDLQAGRPKEEQEYYDQVFTQRNNLRQTDEKIRRLLLQPALGNTSQIWPESTDLA